MVSRNALRYSFVPAQEGFISQVHWNCHTCQTLNRACRSKRFSAHFTGIKMDKEHTIRVTAYSIWESEGRPEGRSEEHWAEAEKHVMSGRRTAAPANANAKASQEPKAKKTIAAKVPAKTKKT
jgi:hypothetical protein